MEFENNCLSCRKCDLHKNQKTIFSNIIKSDIMWIGMSAQQNKNDFEFEPLDKRTPSGKFICSVEDELPDYLFYKTNLVKCLPLDFENKIRYPTNKEYSICFDNLLKEIELVEPKFIFLLGGSVSKFVCKKFNVKKEKYVLIPYKDKFFIVIDHPSFLMVYKRKSLNKYINKIVSLIQNNFKIKEKTKGA